MDPNQHLDDVGVPLWCHRFHAPHLLETEVLSHKHALLDWLYCTGSLLHIRHHIILRRQDCTGSSDIHTGHLHSFNAFRVPDQV